MYLKAEALPTSWSVELARTSFWAAMVMTESSGQRDKLILHRAGLSQLRFTGNGPGAGRWTFANALPVSFTGVERQITTQNYFCQSPNFWVDWVQASFAGTVKSSTHLNAELFWRAKHAVRTDVPPFCRNLHHSQFNSAVPQKNLFDVNRLTVPTTTAGWRK